MNSFSRSLIWGLLAITVLTPSLVRASVCSIRGKISVINKLAVFCDGKSWKNMSGAPVGACSKSGEIRVTSSDFIYCDGTSLYTMKGAAKGSCSKHGTIVWNGSAPAVCIAGTLHSTSFEPTSLIPSAFLFVFGRMPSASESEDLLRIFSAISPVGYRDIVAMIRKGMPGNMGSPLVRSNNAIVVSPNGSGSACSESKPCSIVMGQAVARSRISSASDDITVLLTNGTYELTGPLTFTEADSGANGHFVNYFAMPGAHPILSGGIQIKNWMLVDSSKNIYAAPVPDGVDTRQFYVDGVRAERAQIRHNGSGLPPGFKVTATGYTSDFPLLGQLTNVQNIEVTARWAWQQDRCRVKSISPGPRVTITMDPTCWNSQHSIMKKAVHSIENAYELLSKPGQWFLNKKSKTIYYIPRPGNTLSSVAIVPRLEKLVTNVDSSGKVHPIKNIRFRGITFSFSTWLEPNTVGYVELQAGIHNSNNAKIPGSVNLSAAKNIEFLNNSFIHLGSTALNLDRGSQNVQILGNSFYDISGGAIFFGDVSDAWQANPVLQNANVTISNNLISTTGVEYEGTVALFLGYVDTAKVRSNEISHTSYTGISVGWGWGTNSYAKNIDVSKNYIHDVMLTLKDGGGIYTLSAQPNSSLTENFIQAVGPYGSCTYSKNTYLGYVGIYHDQGSQGFKDVSNVVQRTCGYWLMLQDLTTLPLSANYGTSSANNFVSGNYVDLDRVVCAGQYGVTSGICNNNARTPGNQVSRLSVFGLSATPAAQQIMAKAGSSPAFKSMKSAVPDPFAGFSNKGRLDSNTAMIPGHGIRSPNRRYTLVVQKDGNVVLYDDGLVPALSSNTAGQAISSLIMQGDGNLVIYSKGGHALWSSGTHGNPGAWFAVQDDGNLVVYSRAGRALWMSRHL